MIAAPVKRSYLLKRWQQENGSIYFEKFSVDGCEL
jgi:hypothetical protein